MGVIPTVPATAWLPPLAAMLVGVWLARRGWRGRKVNDHPACRRCGFDLFGLPETSAACPECGADLRWPRAVRDGVRERRRGVAASGVTLCLLAFAWAAGAGWVYSRGVDLNVYKPTWLLTREADSADPAVRDAALRTLVDRSDAGKLSAGQIDK